MVGQELSEEVADVPKVRCRVVGGRDEETTFRRGYVAGIEETDALVWHRQIAGSDSRGGLRKVGVGKEAGSEGELSDKVAAKGWAG